MKSKLFCILQTDETYKISYFVCSNAQKASCLGLSQADETKKSYFSSAQMNKEQVAWRIGN